MNLICASFNAMGTAILIVVFPTTLVCCTARCRFLLPQQLNNVILNDYLRSCWPICCNLLGAIQTQGSGVVLIKAFSIARPLRRSETDTSIIFQPAKCRVEFECELIFIYKMFDVK